MSNLKKMIWKCVFVNDLESGCLWLATETKNSIFGTTNGSKIRTCTVLNILFGECNFEISGLEYCKTLSWKGNAKKLQHTYHPCQIGTFKSYIYVYRVIKTIKFYFLYFTISSCFPIWWKNLLYRVTKFLHFKKKNHDKVTIVT